jgi:hypothetical protein
MRPTDATARIEDPKLAPEVIELRQVQPLAALSPTNDRLMDAYLQFEPHDLYVTSRSVLGYEAGTRFLDVLAHPGPALVDPPLAIDD